MTAGRWGHTMTRLPDGRILVTGPARASTEIYDPATGIWTATSSMLIARESHSATLLPTGKVLATGGQDESGFSHYASAELFDPAIGTWSLTGSVHEPRGAHTATLLATGKVLVAGGTTTCSLDVGCFTTGSAEICEP